MKRKGGLLIGILAFLLGIGTAGLGQIVENPARPAAKDAGRILKLTEIWRITDDRGGFFFRSPRNPQFAADGSFFIADKEELLRFSSEGKFIKNIFRQGQGPGEIDSSFIHFTQGSSLFIRDLNSWRFWRADFDGVLEEQIVIGNTEGRALIGVVPRGYIFLRMVWPPRSEWTGRLMEIIHFIDFVAKDGSERNGIATFKTRAFLRPQAATNWDSTTAAVSPGGTSLFAFFGRDYLVEVVDLVSGRAMKKFRRTYPKVPHVENSWESDLRKKYGFPKIEYETDIRGLYPADGRVWVETSTEDKTKGRLIDVFDEDGRFADSFYLGAGRSLMAVREGVVFCQEKNEDETIAVVKYRIGQ